MIDFKHPALEANQRTEQKLIYTAMSKDLFYLRLFITKHVLEEGCVPLNPFTTFDYFLLDTVDRDMVRRGNNTLVSRADEVWTYGQVSDGVLAELIQAHDVGKQVRHFSIDKHGTVKALEPRDLKFEDDVEVEKEKYLNILSKLKQDNTLNT